MPNRCTARRCTARLATLCTDRPERLVYLDSLRDALALCAPCIAFAERVGLNPVADRRRTPRSAAA